VEREKKSNKQMLFTMMEETGSCSWYDKFHEPLTNLIPLASQALFIVSSFKLQLNAEK